METKMIVNLVIAAVLLIMNINAFCWMAHDKKQAQKDKGHCHPETRVPEKKLFLMTGLFGGIGGCLGMYLKRHKTKHWYFALFFPVMAILQIAILVAAHILIEL
ncbi:MAG: DUF1294 domain-containing protein [Sphaerochaetaceae bacterium]|nr:DUF1294 domain-containing protein [Sphaerochaetaceae bacterium]